MNGKSELVHLVHIISNDRFKVDPYKIQTIVDWSTS